MEHVHVEAIEHAAHGEHVDTKVFGFWVYLMTDLIIFAVLFACFLVLHEQYLQWTFR